MQTTARTPIPPRSRPTSGRLLIPGGTAGGGASGSPAPTPPRLARQGRCSMATIDDPILGKVDAVHLIAVRASTLATVVRAWWRREQEIPRRRAKLDGQAELVDEWASRGRQYPIKAETIEHERRHLVLAEDENRRLLLDVMPRGTRELWSLICAYAPSIGGSREARQELYPIRFSDERGTEGRRWNEAAITELVDALLYVEREARRLLADRIEGVRGMEVRQDRIGAALRIIRAQPGIEPKMLAHQLGRKWGTFRRHDMPELKRLGVQLGEAGLVPPG